MSPRKKEIYFKRDKDTPEPVVVDVRSRTSFSDVDVMGVVWFGKYPLYFEKCWAELARFCGLSYQDFYEARLRPPVVECHIDYHAPLFLDEEFIIRGSLIWNEGSRLNTEYQLIKSNGELAASGYTIQLLMDLEGNVCITSPPLLETCRRRWKKGEFH